MIALALAIQMSDVQPANGVFQRGAWRGDCVRGGDGARADTCRAVLAGPIRISILRTAAELTITARPSGCSRTLRPIIVPGDQLDGMRRAAVVTERIDVAARAAIRVCASKAHAPVLDGRALFDMLAATDGLVSGDE